MSLSKKELLKLAKQAGIDAHVKNKPDQTLLTTKDGKNLTNEIPPFKNGK